jgi:glycosyltransferase involved in cell wall biosynthesis
LDLSIIIAAYNVEKYIEKCIVSCIQDVTDFSYDIVVVNDGSTDRTREILTELASRYPIVKIVDQQNSGLGAARNTGLQNAAGEYVWMIDGDDYLHENVIPLIINEAKSQNLDTLILNYAVVDEQYKLLPNHANVPTNINGIVTGADYYESNYSKSYTWLFVFKKELFIKNAIFFMERINMQDSEILPKLMARTSRLAYFDKICYYYVQQTNSFTNSASGEKRYKYFESIITVGNSLDAFLKTSDSEQIKSGIKKKLASLDQVIFNHLVFFKFESHWLQKIITLLSQSGFFPLRYNPSGKMKFVKLALNNFPILTKKVIDRIR